MTNKLWTLRTIVQPGVTRLRHRQEQSIFTWCVLTFPENTTKKTYMDSQSKPAKSWRRSEFYPSWSYKTCSKSNFRPPQPTPFENLVQHAYLWVSNLCWSPSEVHQASINLFNLTFSQDESPFNHCMQPQVRLILSPFQRYSQKFRWNSIRSHRSISDKHGLAGLPA